MRQITVLLLILLVSVSVQGCAPKNVVGAKMEEKVYTIADFTKIKIGMEYDEVLKLMDDSAITSNPNIGNFRWQVYNLTDNSKIKLGFLATDVLFTIEIIDPDGRTFVLNQDE